MNKDLILTDVDGVLLDWETAFHDWMESKQFKRLSVGTYDMHTAYGITKEHSKILVKEFNSSAWMCCLQPLRDAVWGVEQLANAGYRFGVITSLSLDPYAKKLREENLARYFGDVFEFVQCLDTGADKDEALLPYKDSGLTWIEDKPENAKLGADFGLKTFMLRHAHNATFNYDGVTNVDNWTQIVNSFKR